jgi:bile acid-coenzyme A ligase
LPERVARHWKAPTSGGSTGRPKLIVAEVPGEFDPEEEGPLVQVARMARDRVHLVPGPLYHNAPFSSSMRALFRGNHLVVLPRFDALRTLECIERYRIDYVLLVPTMMQRIWRLEPEVRNRFDLSSLRVMVHMAAPCPAWLKEEWIKWLGPERIHELYGGTEAQAATWITGSEWLEHRGSVGKCFVGRIRVLDEDGHDVPPGQIGEIYMMPDDGPGTTYHYVGAEPKKLDGWESLGDMGRVDAEGYVYLADRQTDMILRGGSNVYPAEVEAAIDAHPQVRSSAVIGLPDEDLGQRVHAIVDTPQGVTEEELRAHLAERLVRYKIPESYEFVSGPLRADDGKVRRSALRDERTQAMGSEASK